MSCDVCVCGGGGGGGGIIIIMGQLLFIIKDYEVSVCTNAFTLWCRGTGCGPTGCMYVVTHIFPMGNLVIS